MANQKSKIPRPERPNPSQAEGDLETIEHALRLQDVQAAAVLADEDNGKVSPEEAVRIESYDLPEAC